VDAERREARQGRYAVVDESEEDIFAGRGFFVRGRRHRYVLPTGPAPVGPPAGFGLISAAGSDVDRLFALDRALREQGAPATAGWGDDPAEFRRRTFSDPAFDPDTYLIAVEAATGDYVGLVRIWTSPPSPYLGLVGVLPAHRRRGLATALLAAALGALHRRGHAGARCEVDETDTAANALVARLDARRVGGTIEVQHPNEP
jgi:ribosomal protein S18 acetylase RimI-like enzyme